MKTNLIEIVPDAIVGINENGIVNVWNKAAGKIFGYSKNEIIGQQITTIIPERYRKQPKDGLLRFVKTGKPRIMNKTVEVSGITKKGAEVPIEMSLVSDKDKDGNHLFLAIIRDITKRKKSERRLIAQHAVTQVLSECIEVKVAFQKILQAVCEALEWDYGAVWTCFSQNNILRCSEVWSVPTLEVSEFTKKIKEISFSLGIGLPGRVWSSGKSSWINDVIEDSNFPRAAVSSKVGLHGAFGFPITANKEIIGVMEFFSKTVQEPDEDLLCMMTAVGSQIGLFLKRNQADKEQVESEKKYRELIETAQEAFVGIEEKGIINIWNKTAENIFMYTKSEIMGKPISTIFPSETIDKLRQNRFVKSNKIVQFPGKTKNGSLIPLEVSISSQTNDNKEYFSMFIIRDITEKKKLENKIQHLASFPQLNFSPIIEISSLGSITFYNNAASESLKRLGLKEDLTLFLPENPNEIIKTLKRKTENNYTAR